MAKHGKFGTGKFGTGHFGWEWQDAVIADPEPISVSTRVYKRVDLRISILDFRLLSETSATQVLQPKATDPVRALSVAKDIPRITSTLGDGVTLKITVEGVTVSATVLEHTLLTADASHQNTLGTGEEEVV